MDFLALVSNPWMWAIAVLIIFAAIDLVVGVTNDAVNFLNSSFWSKVASRKTILWVAALGILIGVFLSWGMMEIARKGIFNPALFTFYDIVIVFFSVVMASAIILDIYNRLKLPTSTTVLIVFELLGAWLAIALIHLFQDDLTISRMGEFINGSSTITIIIGIFLSVIIAFVTGWLIQTLVRSLVTFEYKTAIARWWWIFWGVSIAVMIYFLVVKGLQQVAWFPPDLMTRMIEHSFATLWMLFAWGALFTLAFQYFWNGNILKVIVLLGTFSLAAAFAGNDLVNFIGVPIAWFQAIMLYITAGSWDMQMLMTWLVDGVSTPQIFLLWAALIMIITLLSSKKIQAISNTEIGLTKHATWQEQFKPWKISRRIVKKTIRVHKKILTLLPSSWQEYLAWRFLHASASWQVEESWAAYDLIRASVNLTLAAILIAFATTLKLPLSTTYVTFMVAMGTALADGAWGRDSAVYRISGVITIIGSWFLTALISLVGALILTLALWYMWFWALGVAVIIVGYLFYRSYFAKKSDRATELAQVLSWSLKLSEILTHHATSIVGEYSQEIRIIIDALVQEDEKTLIDAYTRTQDLAQETKTIKRGIHRLFASLEEDATLTGHTYVQWIEFLRKATLGLATLSLESKEYVQNNHPEFLASQHKELSEMVEIFGLVLEQSLELLTHPSYSLSEFDRTIQSAIASINLLRQEQFERIKSGTSGVRNATLYTSLLAEFDTILINIQKLLHYHRKMIAKS